MRVRQPFVWVAQQEAADCGVAALAMVVRFHGREVSFAELRQATRVGPCGSSLHDLQQAATTLGFHCPAVQIGPEQLVRVTLPAIAHLAAGHYVVLYDWNPTEAVVGDPARGIVTWTADAFRQVWAGRLLLPTPADRRSV